MFNNPSGGRGGGGSMTNRGRGDSQMRPGGRGAGVSLWHNGPFLSPAENLQQNGGGQGLDGMGAIAHPGGAGSQFGGGNQLGTGGQLQQPSINVGVIHFPSKSDKSVVCGCSNPRSHGPRGRPCNHPAIIEGATKFMQQNGTLMCTKEQWRTQVPQERWGPLRGRGWGQGRGGGFY
ncbi:hypothetical protein BDV96DRAFT_661903 [Lophiotrema nucula]|uniref:Uncharacterized protein n=1 Tax=Lophiotrema nucula TaxID=690887 RepID=A0A6A5Z3R2_9PLEO|nr:hypothetical protein BDV96DRAFT_661903 [Lophiotrema nucula]